MSSKKSQISGPVKAPLGSYPKLWRLLDHYFLKEDVPDRTALQALDTIVALNNSVIANPKSVNDRSIRSSEPTIRNLVEMGGTDILTECGWSFKVMRMEECWILPYEADLEVLTRHQQKIVETQQKLKDRLIKSLEATSKRAENDKAEKLAVIRQIEHDKAEREHRNALRSGAPPKPSQSLDEIRKQAVRERLEREKARKAKTSAEEPNPSSASPTQFPGSFPSESRSMIAEEAGCQHESESEAQSYTSFPATGRSLRPSDAEVLPGAPTGGRSRRAQQAPRPRRKAAPVPIETKRPIAKTKYQATENKLGGTGAEGSELPETAAEDAMDEDEDETLSDEDEADDDYEEGYGKRLGSARDSDLLD